MGTDHTDHLSDVWKVTITGGANVISSQDPRWTQKPIYPPMFTHHIRSWLLCTPRDTPVVYRRVPLADLGPAHSSKLCSYLHERWRISSKLMFASCVSLFSSVGYRTESFDISIYRNIVVSFDTSVSKYRSFEISKYRTCFFPPTPGIPLFFSQILNESFDVYIKYRNRTYMSISFICVCIGVVSNLILAWYPTIRHGVGAYDLMKM